MIKLLHQEQQLLFSGHYRTLVDGHHHLEKNLQATLKSLGVGLIATDKKLRVTMLNPVAEQLTAWTESEALGKPLREIFRLVEAGTGAPAHLALPESSLPLLVNRYNRQTPVEITFSFIRDSHGKSLGIALVLRNATPRLEAEEKLKRYALLSENSLDMMFYLRPDGTIMEANSAAAQNHGYSREELQLLNLRDLRAPETCLLLTSQLQQAGSRPILFETIHTRKDGSQFPVEVSVNNLRQAGENMLLCVIRDITRRRRFEAVLEHHAFYDSLTGLPNRYLFTDRLQNCLERTKRHKDRQFALLFLDLDQFKDVNDRLGHNTGDKLLVSVARRLENCLRPNDTLARLGGDEFTILLDEIHAPEDALKIARRIKQELSEPFIEDFNQITMTASIGIAFSLTDYRRVEDMLHDADIAMYRAKANGKARYEVFDPVIQGHSHGRLHLESTLEKAFERNQFQLLYQPVVSLSSGKIAALEVLLRWERPDKRLIEPAEFLPIAEQIGLSLPLGRWVIREACRRALLWPRIGYPYWISVNLSSQQFLRAELVSEIEEILKETGFQAGRLKIEISEETLNQNPNLALVLVEELNSLGLEVILDNYGEGPGQLKNLYRFPIEIIKLSRSLLPASTNNQRALELVKGLGSLVNTLQKTAIVKGIETDRQLEGLQFAGFKYGQGHYFAYPVEDGEVRDLLRKTIIERSLPETAFASYAMACP